MFDEYQEKSIVIHRVTDLFHKLSASLKQHEKGSFEFQVCYYIKHKINNFFSFCGFIFLFILKNNNYLNFLFHFTESRSRDCSSI